MPQNFLYKGLEELFKERINHMTEGIPYFPLDVHLDDRFELIEAEFGLVGFAVIVKLFQKIYGGNGYYSEWNDDVALLFSRKNSVGGSVVSEIVSASIKRGIFDKTLYEKYRILTNKTIQERYFEAIKRRSKVKIKEEYLLVKVTHLGENVNNSSQNVNNSEENVYNFKQSKVKERKVKESIEKKNKPSAQNKFCNYTDTNVIDYRAHEEEVLAQMLEDG